jgi:hypothetical protein
MKLDRFRAPALAGTAVLLISGAGIAFAASPSPTVPVKTAPSVVAEPVGPDTDTLQQGDQTTPDTATDTATAGDVTDPAEAAASESASDGPGGHQDPAGQNVDHQFEGQE